MVIFRWHGYILIVWLHLLPESLIIKISECNSILDFSSYWFQSRRLKCYYILRPKTKCNINVGRYQRLIRNIIFIWSLYQTEFSCFSIGSILEIHIKPAVLDKIDAFCFFGYDEFEFMGKLMGSSLVVAFKTLNSSSLSSLGQDNFFFTIITIIIF